VLELVPLVVGGTLVGAAVELGDADLCSASEHALIPRSSATNATSATGERWRSENDAM
jgi:hypothetical protein